MTECPICLSDDVKTANYCHGCDHEFCFRCISLWVTSHAAKCPLCRSNLYGLFSDNSSMYLTPHYGRFGLEIRKRKSLTQLTNVTKDGPAHLYNLKKGDFILVNDKTSYTECVQQILNAKQTKRMIKIDKLALTKEVKTSSRVNPMTCLRRTSPQGVWHD